MSSLKKLLATALGLVLGTSVVGQVSAVELFLSPTSPTEQKILVIPVVDKDYPYTPGARLVPADLQDEWNQIDSDYNSEAAGVQSARTFWNEASYGQVKLSGELSNCIYQLQQDFANVGEAEFVLPTTTGSDQFPYVRDIDLSNLTLEYALDPAFPQEVTLSLPAPIPAEDTLDALKDLLADEGVDDVLGVSLVPVTTFDGLGQYRFVFSVNDTVTQLGSYVRVSAEKSDPVTRHDLRFNFPTDVRPSPNTIVYTSDGLLPTGTLTAADIEFVFFNGTTETSFTWEGDYSCGGTCPGWTSPAELATFWAPGDGLTGSVSVVDVGGRQELAFTMQVDPGLVYDRIEVRGHERSLSEFALLRPVDTVGTGSQNLNTRSYELTQEALEQLITLELGSDAGCFATELQNANLPATNDPGFATAYAAMVVNVHNWLNSYSAVHVALLSAGNVARDNASRSDLAPMLTLTAGGEVLTLPYPVTTSSALVELGSGASTIAHEIGHNLTFLDLYDFSNDDNPLPSEFHPGLHFPDGWDVMASHTTMSHPSFYTKQLFNWVETAGGASTARFPRNMDSEEPVPTQYYLITPLEYSAAQYDITLLEPDWTAFGIPAGATPSIVKGVMVAIGADDGGVTPPQYLAIENRQPGTRYSQSLPEAEGAIYISDNIRDLKQNGSYAKPISRNYSHRQAAQAFEPPNSSVVLTGDDSSFFPKYSGLTVSQMGVVTHPDGLGESIVVAVDYPNPKEFDLAIEPWGAPPYATRAIWFEPGSPTAPTPTSVPTDPVGTYQPVYAQSGYVPPEGAGPLNWIMVAVENKGNIPATSVTLKLSTRSPGAMGDIAEWLPIEQGVAPTRNVDPGETAIFAIPWSPTTDQIGDAQHTCVAAEVIRWFADGTWQLADVVPLNNLSQENVQLVYQTSSSPWKAQEFEFSVYNHYHRDIDVQMEATGLLPGYLLDLDQTVFSLASKETKTIGATFRWDEEEIPMPPNQDPADPYWQACNGGSAPCLGEVYEAESMYQTTGGPTQDGWNIWSDGYISEYHTFGPGETTITVRARGQYANGWPLMQVWVSEAFLGEVLVDSSDWKDYEFTVDAGGYGGTYGFYVQFVNDYYAPPLDRNLLVDKVTIGCSDYEEVEGELPPHCGGLWNLTAYALVGGYRVPLGGVSYEAVGKPTATLTTDTTVDQNTGDVTVEGTVEPPTADQPVRVHVGYPNGDQEILTTTTGPDGSFQVPFTPGQRGPVTVTTELPPGGPFAPTADEGTTVDACVPDSD